MSVFVIVGAFFGFYLAYVAIKIFLGYLAAEENVRKAVAFTRKESTRKKTILVLGDSTAVGVGAEATQSTAARVGDALNANVENYAASGAKVSDLKAQFQRKSKSFYDLVLVQIGANDVIYFSSLEKASREFEALASSFTSVAPVIVLLTAGDIGKAPLFPVPVSYVYTARTKYLRSAFKAIAEKNGLVYIDLFTLPNPFLNDISKYYSSDRLHLSSNGYEVWSNYILEAICGKI